MFVTVQTYEDFDEQTRTKGQSKMFGRLVGKMFSKLFVHSKLVTHMCPKQIQVILELLCQISYS